MRFRKCFSFTGEEPFFQGHFPGLPVLPGVMQLEFAHQAAEAAAGRKLVLKEVRKVKFVRVVTPADRLELELEGDAGTIAFTFFSGDRKCSSGVLVY